MDEEVCQIVKKETVGFRCKDCGNIIKLGKCGEHRVETEHKDYVAIYDTGVV